MSEPAPLRCVGLLGGGVIGGGWAARFLLNGIDVRLYDPDPEAIWTVGRIVERGRRAYAKLTSAPLPQEGMMIVSPTPEDAVDGVDFVQESAPERVELKQDLLAAASRASGPEIVFGSSTSGLRPTLLQERMEHPERFVVGHPFNPVYLLPLVELCAGSATSAAAVARAQQVYRSIGMHPLVVRTEIDGFLADRLLEALWREALWLVHDDVATVAEVDDAIRYGAGLRWACMGTFLTYRLAGGEAGMRHFLAHFGPALELPWTKLVDVPELTPEVIEKVAGQSDRQAAGQSIDELERLRDDTLVGVLHALRAHGTGAGQTLREWESLLLHGAPAGESPAPPAESEPLTLYVREVPADWIDYNGHVTEYRYLQVLADATDALLGYIGLDAGYLRDCGSYYTVESHIEHRGQLFAGDRVTVRTQVLGADEKRLHLFHAMLRGGETVATGEHMLVHVVAEDGRAGPVRSPVRERLGAPTGAHSAIVRPERAGRRIALPDPATRSREA